MGVLSAAHILAVLAAPVRAFVGPMMLTVVLRAYLVLATAHQAVAAAVQSMSTPKSGRAPTRRSIVIRLAFTSFLL